MDVVIEATPFPITGLSLPKADSCVVVIFGALGDLATRKLVPALFRLAGAGCLSSRFKVLGVAREQMNDEKYRERMRAGMSGAKEAGKISDAEWRAFAGCLHYLQGDLHEVETYRLIARRLEKMTLQEGASENRLFYISTPPSVAPSIVHGLGIIKLSSEEKGWSRVVVEKPFGRDLKSARALNDLIADVFDENQIYRIDHYLGKETVQNIIFFRFSNSMFEPIWNRNYVNYVEITAAEMDGVGRRGGYYEEGGALRDMVANHLLQLLTLTAMAPPVEFDADAVRDEKVRVLRSIHPMTPEEAPVRAVRGQYGAGEIDGQRTPAYRDEKGVAKDSLTETYAAVEFQIGRASCRERV